MYEEVIAINNQVFRRFRKKMTDLKEFYADMDVTFQLNGQVGEEYLKVVSNSNEDFNQAVKEIKLHIHKFMEDYAKRQNYKRIEKEKNHRKRIKSAEKKIKKNIKEYDEKKDVILSAEVKDDDFKNNMFYGLKIDIDCP